MINYDEKLKELRFNFRPEEIVDYEALVSLIGSIIVNDKYEEFKEEIFHTIQIIVLVYGLDENTATINFVFDPNNIDLDNLDLWKYLIVSLYNCLIVTSDFRLDENIKNTYFLVLNELEKKFNKNSEAEIFNETISTKYEEENQTEEKRKGMFLDDSSYSFVEPDNFSFSGIDTFESQNDLEQNNQDFNINNPILNNSLNDFNWEYLEKYVFINQVIPYQCDICGMNEWQGKMLPLILLRKDNENQSQDAENLKYLCPNCYSQVGKK